MAPYVSFVTYYRHYPDTSTSLDRITFYTKNVRELSKQFGLDSEIVIVESEPGILADKLGAPDTKIVDFPRTPFMGHLAFNIGVRRAAGEYIVVSSRDSIFNTDLMAFLATKKLRPRTVYRLDRRDVKELETYAGSVPDIQRYCAENVRKVHGLWDSYLPKKKWARPASRALTYARFFPYAIPHTNACGDFTLMHRDDWYRVRGYPQIISSGLHLDSFVIYVAIFSGIKQVVLRDPMRLYHIDHPRTDPVPAEYIRKCLNMMRFTKKPMILNDENWGL